jgi:tRNA(Ile2) C34 agmatinyltransferase TiaS
MKYYIGIDDTDNLESRGTGHLARFMAQALSQDFEVHGVTRHQLFEDPRVPMTAKNSCACIAFSGVEYPLAEIAQYARKIMLDDFQPGSDPGLCVASHIPPEVIAYSRRVQSQIIQQTEPRDLAPKCNIHLEGLGGTEDGVIGALAAVGLFAQGDDGRYVLVGRIRELEGLHPVAVVKAAGVVAVRTLAGDSLTSGLIQTDKMRPARRNGHPIVFVERNAEHWLPIKLN